MKRYINFIGTLLVALAIINCSYAQEVSTTVAEGTVTNMFIPIYGLNASTPQHQQVIYPDELLTDMVGGTISSMTFYMSSMPANAWNCSFSISLGTTGATSFSSSSILPVDNIVEVFSGPMQVDASTSQMTIVFTQPFTYAGGNLLLDIQNSVGGINSNAFFLGINPSVNRSLCVFELSGNVLSLLQAFTPKTTFVYSGGSSCLTPTDLTVVEANATSATVSWSSQTSGAQYQVYCDTAGADLSNANWILTSDTFFTFNNLTPNALHVAYVRSYCGVQTSNVANVSFRTDCDAIISEFPWSERFENTWFQNYSFGQQNSSPQCWKIYNGGTTEHSAGTGAFYWKINTNSSQVHSGQHSAVCYTDYATGRHNDWLVSPMFNLTGGQRVTFFVQNNTDNTSKMDEISVWISDENATLQVPISDTAALPGFTQLFQTEIPVGGFRNYEVSLAGYSGQRYIAFVRRNAPNAGWYLCLDDVTVENIPPCAAPTNLNANPSAHGAQLTWEAESVNYNLYYKQVSNTEYTSIFNIGLHHDLTYFLSDLIPATTYQWYVEAICDNQRLMQSEIATFTTSCALIANVPQTWDFESNNSGGTPSRPLPACWERKGSTIYPYVYTDQYTAYNGLACLYSGGGVANATAVLPQIDVNALSVNTLQVRFFAKHVGGSNGTVEVGLMSDPADSTTFVSVHTIPSLTGNYEEYRVSFAHASTAASYIVMRMTPNDGNLYIDDLVLEEIPACDRPMGLSCSNITSNSATVSWSSSAELSKVYIQEAGSGAFVLTSDSPVSGTSYTFNNLLPNTLYGVYIASVCDSIEIASSVLSFTSDCIALDTIPYTWDFESNNTSGVAAYPMQACWNRLNAAVTSMYVSNVSVMAHSGSHSMYSVYPNDYVLVLPTIDTAVLPLNRLLLSFYAKTNYGREATLEVGILTNPEDPTYFELLETFPLTMNYQLFEVMFSRYPAQANHLAFRLNSNSDFIVIDDVTLEAAPPCPKPYNFQCISMSTNTVTLAWEPGSDEEYWYLVYGLHGFDMDTVSNILFLDSNVVQIENLTNALSYDFYVRANCGEEDGQSGWVGLYDVIPGSYNMHRNGIDSLFTCGAVIYDDGGPDGAYSNSCDSYLVIYPDEEHNFVEINGFLTAESSYWDYLVIYDGAGTTREVYRSTQDGSATVVIPTITSTTGPLTIYFHSDNSVQDRGFTIYTTCVSCVAPLVEVTTVGTDSISLSWAQTDAMSCELVCGPIGFDPNAFPAITLTGTSTYTISNLTPDTLFEVCFRLRCDETSYSEWARYLVSTLPHQPASVPYSCNFETETENALWTLSNGTQTNAWYINTAANNTVNGNKALYISGDGGLTNTYQNEVASTSWAYRDIQFSDANEFLLSFDWRSVGEGGGSYLWDYLSVYIGNPVRKEAGDNSEPQGAILLDDLLMKSAWNVAEYVFGREFANTTKRLYFVWQNDDSYGENPPAAIDNISIRAVNCARPIDLTVDAVTTTTATISVTSIDEGAVAWQLKYGNNMIVTVTDSVYVLTGLTPATEYEVCARSICANGDSSRWTPTYVFLTACQAIGSSDIPYSCGFESGNHGGTEVYPLPTCWNRIGLTDYPFVDSYEYDAYTGFQSLRSGEDPVNSIVVMPEINTTEIPINTLQVSFYAKVSGYFGSTGSIEVGVMNSADDTASFVPMDTINSLTSIYKEYELLLDLYEGHGSYLALRLNAVGGVNDYGYYGAATIYIDDVVIGYIPPCRRPDNLVCIDNTSTSVTVSWNPRGHEEQWAVAIGDLGFDPLETGVVHVADTNVYELDNLISGTVYDVYVRANCGGEGNSVWYGPLTVVPGVVYMRTSGVDTIYACDVTIYDDGGPYENYSDNCDAYLVIYPDQPGQFVQVTGSAELENYYYDYMEIFDGGTNQLLYATHNEQNEFFYLPTIVSSTGPITIHFHSDYTSNFAGFELNATCVSCISPELTLNSFYTDSAVVSWTGSVFYSDYQLVYGVQGFSPSMATPIEVTNATSYTLTELTPNVTYDVYIRIQCDGDAYGNWSNVLSFTTLPGEPARLPYTCDFEAAGERNAWTIVNGMQPNKWYIDTLEGGNNVLYVSGDGGQSNTYIHEGESSVWAYRDFATDDLAEWVLSFDWRCNGESMYGANYDFLKIYFGDAVTLQAGSSNRPAGTTEIDLLSMQDSWTEAEYSLGNVDGGAVKRLYFLWRNDYTEGWDPAAAIDNIEIKAIHCAQPVDLRATNITSNSVDMVVTYANESVVGWQLQYGDNDPVTVMGDTLIEVANLNPATVYEFFARSICNNGDTSVWTSCTVITDCITIGSSNLPYTCDFESNNIAGTSAYPLPACWQRTNATLPYIDVTTYWAHSGIRYLYTGQDATDLFVILPQINTVDLPINQLQLGFYAQISDFEGSIDVGVMTDPTNTMTFVPVGTISTLAYEYTEYEISLAQYSGNGSYIAMRLNSRGGFGPYGDYLYSLMYVDDVTLDYIPDCPHPDNLSQSNITPHTADLTWSDVANSYILYYRELGTTDYMTENNVTLTNGVYTLSGLNAATTYEWYVASLCINGSEVPSHTSGTFTTLCETIVNFPYQETFNNSLGCWVSSVIMGENWQWQIANQYGDTYDPDHLINAAEGSHYAQAYFPSTGNILRLTSPVFDLTSLDEPYIKFYHIQLDWYGDQDYLKIYYKTSPEAQPVLLAEYTTLIFPWRLDSLALPNPSANYQLYFDAYLNWGYGVGVDNVIVYDHNGGVIPHVELPVVVTNAASEITDSSAVLHGTITVFGNQAITMRGFEWKLTTGGTYVQVLDAGTDSNMTYALSGLTDSTSYTYRAFVSTTDTTVYGAEVQFTTLAAPVVITCDMPTNLQVSNVTSTSAEVSWTAGGVEDTWVVEHKLQGTSEWQVQTVNTTQVTLTDLTPSSTYMVRVKSVCDNEESGYVTTSFVTTVGICNVNYEQYIQLMPNPADDYIDLRINNNMEVKEAVIYNAFGQMVQTVVLTDNYARIDLSGMASGMYFVRVRHDQGIVTKKFIKR